VTREYDAIVVGLGGMGSSAAYHLAARGKRVLGLDAHAPGHTLGSSHGESRIIRLAYLEHPDYVPLLRRAYDLWREAADRVGSELMRLTGGLFVGPPEGSVVGGSLESARLHGLDHELLDADEIHRRHPAMRPSETDVALFEPTAGILFPERCIAAHLRLAALEGADLRHEEPVRSWTATDGGVEVRTDEGRYSAGALVLTAGTWLGKLLAAVQPLLQPERAPVYWLHPRESPELFEPGRFPIYIWETADLGVYYGFPHLERPGVKLGLHHSGDLCDPDTLDRRAAARDEAAVRAFASSRLPALNGPVASSLVCIYTNTPDEHFLIDRWTEHPSVVYAGGFSGHGFKFASVVGEILADLATTGAAAPEANFLRSSRFAAPTLQAGGP